MIISDEIIRGDDGADGGNDPGRVSEGTGGGEHLDDGIVSHEAVGAEFLKGDFANVVADVV